MVDIKPLEGWITVQQAAGRLKVSYQTIHNMIDRGELEARAVGGERRSLYLVSEAEITKLEETKASGSYTLS